MSHSTQDPEVIKQFKNYFMKSKPNNIIDICFSGNMLTKDATIPYSGLTSFDFGKEIGLYSNNFDVTDSCIYSDRLRNYQTYDELYKKYKMKDDWVGLKLQTVSEFISELISNKIEITRLSVTIDARGYPTYIVRYK